MKPLGGYVGNFLTASNVGDFLTGTHDCWNRLDMVGDRLGRVGVKCGLGGHCRLGKDWSCWQEGRRWWKVIWRVWEVEWKWWSEDWKWWGLGDHWSVPWIRDLIMGIVMRQY